MKWYIETYGCTANKSDESLIRGVLLSHHHEPVEDIHQADVLIIVTCTVIGTTEQRMVSRFRFFKKTKKPVIVTGCMSAVQQALITEILPDAFLLKPSELSTIVDIVSGNKTTTQENNTSWLPARYTSQYAPITIAEGCLQKCSYCITRLARGSLHSYPKQHIIAYIQEALRQGCTEIQLTAQDTAAYGYDLNSSLDELVGTIPQKPNCFRIRIGMMNPYTVRKRFSNILACYRHPNVYRFIHLPVQAGDNMILQKMNRQYTVEEFREMVTTFRAKIPDISLSTDVIVGFPTETDDQFHHTCTFLKNIKPDIVNITRFSARPNTPAKTMSGRIPTKVIKQRSQYLSELCKQLQRTKNKKFHGKKYTVLITELGKNNTFFGRTDTYKPVVLHEQVHLGEFVSVQIIDSSEINLFGKLI
ncbi:MAG: tRNA (N(6)-L-threonylcarbamoyladenosine(37)-C(2))-methylthiotransferase [Candidatus Thermoplasmatota archaeon]